MREQTERLALIWFRVTLVLAALVTIVTVRYGPGSAEFWIAAAVAVVAELVLIRGLVREWSWQARGCWWRFW